MPRISTTALLDSDQYTEIRITVDIKTPSIASSEHLP